MGPDELERRLQERFDALPQRPHAELLHVLTLPDFDRADRISSYWARRAGPYLERPPLHAYRPEYVN